MLVVKLLLLHAALTALGLCKNGDTVAAGLVIDSSGCGAFCSEVLVALQRPLQGSNWVHVSACRQRALVWA